MLREQSRIINWLQKSFDICITFASFNFAYFMKKDLLAEPFRGLITGPNYQLVVLLAVIFWYFSLKFFKVYSSYRTQSYFQISWKVIKASAVAMAMLSLSMYGLKITNVSRLMMGIFFVFNLSMLLLIKAVVYAVLSHLRRKGFNFRNLLIVGGRKRAVDVIKAVIDHMDAGYRILVQTDFIIIIFSIPCTISIPIPANFQFLGSCLNINTNGCIELDGSIG